MVLNAFNIFVRLLRLLPTVLPDLQQLPPNTTEIYREQTTTTTTTPSRHQQHTVEETMDTSFDTCLSELCQLHVMMSHICSSALQGASQTLSVGRKRKRIKDEHLCEQRDLLLSHVSNILEKYTSLMRQQLISEDQTTAAHVSHWFNIVMSLIDMNPSFFQTRLRLCHILVSLAAQSPSLTRTSISSQVLIFFNL